MGKIPILTNILQMGWTWCTKDTVLLRFCQARAWWTRHCRRALETHPLLQGRAYRRTLLQNCTSARFGEAIFNWHTLQGITISHLGKRKIIFKMQFFGDMLVPWRVTTLWIGDDHETIPKHDYTITSDSLDDHLWKFCWCLLNIFPISHRFFLGGRVDGCFCHGWLNLKISRWTGRCVFDLIISASMCSKLDFGRLESTPNEYNSAMSKSSVHILSCLYPNVSRVLVCNCTHTL